MHVDEKSIPPRKETHDFRRPCVYYFSLRVRQGLPLLGRVEGSEEEASVQYYPLGNDVEELMQRMLGWQGDVKLNGGVVMPDHVHLMLEVLRWMDYGTSALTVIDEWRVACNERAWQLGIIPVGESLFEQGGRCRIVKDEGQRKRLIRYMYDNPRRTILQAENAQWFEIHRGVDIGGRRFDAVGNLDLLHMPMIAVHARRDWDEERQLAYGRRCLVAAEDGCVLVGAFVSDIEQSVGILAVEKGASIIPLMGRGFPEGYKPDINAFYTCAEGRLLQLSAWPMASQHKLNRTMCKKMNEMAEKMAHYGLCDELKL